MTLNKAQAGKSYTVTAIESDDRDMNSFLFSLGCYSGETVTVLSRTRKNLIISVKNSKYSIDSTLADAITV